MYVVHTRTGRSDARIAVSTKDVEESIDLEIILPDSWARPKSAIYIKMRYKQFICRMRISKLNTNREMDN